MRSRATASSLRTAVRNSATACTACSTWSRSRRSAEAPSDLAIIGRYILTPDIFPALAATKSDRTGEIQLTNGLRELLKTRPIYACEVKGVRHDTGNKLGFLKAVVYFALRAAGPRRQVHRVPDVAGDSREDQRLSAATTSAWCRRQAALTGASTRPCQTSLGLRLGLVAARTSSRTSSSVLSCRSLFSPGLRVALRLAAGDRLNPCARSR